jgi:hypothetical protein
MAFISSKKESLKAEVAEFHQQSLLVSGAAKGQS